MGSKSSKRSSLGDVTPLSRDTIAELCHDTGFTEEELLAWHTNFYKDCPDGKLTLKQFEQEYAKIMGKPTQKTADYVRHMFNVYDHDKNQFIDFKEFVMALSAASVVNRLRLVETLFHVFDLDNDGKITKEEIGKMLHTLVDVTNSNDKRRHRHHRSNQQQQRTKQINLQKRIDDAFNELNANDDDHITKDEFIEWYMKSGLISEVQSEVNVPDPSRIQLIGKKSRKLVKQTSYTKSNNKNDERRYLGPPLVRHMSRMTEKKPASSKSNHDVLDNNRPTTVSFEPCMDEDDHIDTDDEHELNNPSTRVIKSSDDTDSHYSKENERWQHLFNSVIGQIRSQRQKEPQQTTNNTNNNRQGSFNSWKREGEEIIKLEYMKQRSNNGQNHSNLSTKAEVLQSSLDESSADDILTARF